MAAAACIWEIQHVSVRLLLCIVISHVGLRLIYWNSAEEGGDRKKEAE